MRDRGLIDDLDTIENTLKAFDQDYVIQEVLKNHPDFAEANPDSLQTLRVVTLSYNEKISFVGAILRMAISGRVDNYSQGGIACGVQRDGVLDDFAVDYVGNRYTEHPSGYQFAGKKLYKADACIESALKLHATVPQERIIAWDMTVSDSGEVVMIEYNSPGGTEAMQSTGKNVYCDKLFAKEIFDEYLIRRFYYVRANFDWNYREFVDHVSLLKYGGLDEEIEVPANIAGKKVLMVYNDAFKGSAAKSVRVPASVRANVAVLKRLSPGVEFVTEEKRLD